MWKAQPITEETGWCEIKDGDTYIGATRGPNSERNAQIMAAGEEMLEALKGAFALAIGHAATYQFQHELDAPHPIHQEILDKARAAIAKAEGKQ